MLAAAALAAVIPTLSSPADVVATIVIAVVVLAFVIWAWRRGGGWGGWGNSGRMGN